MRPGASTAGWRPNPSADTRTTQLQAGEHVITAADPPPADVHQVLKAIETPSYRTLIWPNSVPDMRPLSSVQRYGLKISEGFYYAHLWARAK